MRRAAMTRTQRQLVRDRVRLQNQREAFLEESRIKLSSPVSDLLGRSGRRMIQAPAEGETDPARIAQAADRSLRAAPEELSHARAEAATLSPLHRQILKLFLERLALIEAHRDALERSWGQSLRQHPATLARWAEVPAWA